MTDGSGAVGHTSVAPEEPGEPPGVMAIEVTAPAVQVTPVLRRGSGRLRAGSGLGCCKGAQRKGAGRRGGPRQAQRLPPNQPEALRPRPNGTSSTIVRVGGLGGGGLGGGGLGGGGLGGGLYGTHSGTDAPGNPES